MHEQEPGPALTPCPCCAQVRAPCSGEKGGAGEAGDESGLNEGEREGGEGEMAQIPTGPAARPALGGEPAKAQRKDLHQEIGPEKNRDGEKEGRQPGEERPAAPFAAGEKEQGQGEGEREGEGGPGQPKGGGQALREEVAHLQPRGERMAEIQAQASGEPAAELLGPRLVQPHGAGDALHLLRRRVLPGKDGGRAPFGGVKEKKDEGGGEEGGDGQECQAAQGEEQHGASLARRPPLPAAAPQDASARRSTGARSPHSGGVMRQKKGTGSAGGGARAARRHAMGRK